MFKIKISDGFCEWEYPLLITGTSIDDIHTALCEALEIEKQLGKLVKTLPLTEYEG